MLGVAAYYAVVWNADREGPGPGEVRQVSSLDASVSEKREPGEDVTSAGAAPAEVGGNGEFRVNVYTLDMQDNPSVSALPGGDFVVVWESAGQDGSGEGVFGRRFSSRGEGLGEEFRVNLRPSGAQRTPRAEALAGGGFVTVWEDAGADESASQVLGRIAETDGVPAGEPFRADAFADGLKGDPAVASLGSTGFAALWESNGQDGSGDGVYAQLFDGNGFKRGGGEVRVSGSTAGNQRLPDATAVTDGLVVVWEGEGEEDDGLDIFARRLAQGKLAGGDELRINSHVENNQTRPRVAPLAGGGWVVVWESWYQDGSSSGVFGSRLTPGGGVPGPEFQVNTYTRHSQSRPAVAGFEDGRFVAVWQSCPPVMQAGQDGQDGFGCGVFAQRFAADGAGAGEERRVNGAADGNQSRPSVAALDRDRFVVVWQSCPAMLSDAGPGGDGSGCGVYARIVTY